MDRSLLERLSIITIENLSDELFYEIFDYLDGYDIYNGFSNLNYRFQNLLNSPLLLFKIKLHCPSNQIYKKFCKQLKSINQQQILSLDLDLCLKTGKFYTSFPINSTFSHLESLILYHIEADLLLTVLFNLTSLPRLFSLKIHLHKIIKNLTAIYQIVFTLPKLKSFYFAIEEDYLTISLPKRMNQQFSSIEHLVMNHCCTFEQLSILTSYTPQLYHLDFIHTINNDLTLKTFIPITLSNLTYLRLCIFEIKFDEFELFIKKIDCKLKTLCLLTSSEDINYLDDNRWENFILKYFPQLEKFYFQYFEYIDYNNDNSINIQQSNRFNSSFWIERQWIYEVNIENQIIIYVIHPYKKQWYDDGSLDLSKSARLILSYIPLETHENLLILDICRALTITVVYHLVLPNERVFIGTLIQMIDTLQELHSVKIYSLSLDHSRDLSQEEYKILRASKNRDELIKVYLSQMNDMNDIYFLLKFFRYMKYLQIGCLNNMDIKLFMRNIIKRISPKNNSNLHSLCLSIPTADDHMIHMLNKMIYSNKLLNDYTIKRLVDNIYLEWK